MRLNFFKSILRERDKLTADVIRLDLGMKRYRIIHVAYILKTI